MSEKAINKLSGTCIAIRIEFPQPSDFLGLKSPENEIKIDFTELSLIQQDKLKPILTEIVTEQSGVDGTPTPQTK
jgi:hypothetical protein